MSRFPEIDLCVNDCLLTGKAYFGVFNYYSSEGDTRTLEQHGGPRAHVAGKDQWREITPTFNVGGVRPGQKLHEVRAITGVDENSDMIFKSIQLKKKQ